MKLGRRSLVLVVAGLAALAGCDRASKVTPPSVDAALRLAHEELELPEVRRTEHEPAARAHVIVSRTQISLLGDPWPIATIPPDAALGLASEDKRDGRSGFGIPSLTRALTWQQGDAGARTPFAELGETAEPQTIVIVADEKTTYRVACEVVASIEAAVSSRIAFATRTGDRARPIGIVALGVRRPGRVKGEPLTVRFGQAGAAITMNQRTIAVGCEDVGPGPAVPRAAESFDFAALGACFATMKRLVPELASEALHLSAEPATPLAMVLKVIEAAHSARFDDVVFIPPTAPSAP